jgi:hypothetical protein
MIDSKTTVKNIRQFIKEYGASRYRLLALAFFKGRAYRTIEWTVRKGNEPPAKYITEYLADEIEIPFEAFKAWLETPATPELIRYHEKLKKLQRERKRRDPDTGAEVEHKRKVRALKRMAGVIGVGMALGA